MNSIFKIQTSWELYLESFAIIIIGYIAVKLIGKSLRFKLKGEQPSFQQLVVAKVAELFLNLLVIFIALDHLGINLKFLLGASAVFTVAIGFASQTSASNFISGLFLVSEKPFRPGDVIKVGETTGIVVSIDLLSTRLRTLDNLLIRVPNETLMKSQITNLTFFDIRRIDIKFHLSLEEDLQNIEQSLIHLAEQNSLILDEPRPLFIVDEIEENLIKIQFSLWVQKENYLKIKNEFCTNMLRMFKSINIHIPSSKTFIAHDQMMSHQPPSTQQRF